MAEVLMKQHEHGAGSQKQDRTLIEKFTRLNAGVRAPRAFALIREYRMENHG